MQKLSFLPHVAMRLAEVSFEDENRIDCELFLETTGNNRFWYTLIAKFRGRYRYGSAGRPDAALIRGVTHNGSMSVFLDRFCCRLRDFERVVLGSRRVCEILVCAMMRYHLSPWSLSFLVKVEDLGSVCVASTNRPATFLIGWVSNNLA